MSKRKTKGHINKRLYLQYQADRIFLINFPRGGYHRKISLTKKSNM